MNAGVKMVLVMTLFLSPEGSNKTFGEMELSEKNLFSHRRKATDKLIEFLKQQ